MKNPRKPLAVLWTVVLEIVPESFGNNERFSAFQYQTSEESYDRLKNGKLGEFLPLARFIGNRKCSNFNVRAHCEELRKVMYFLSRNFSTCCTAIFQTLLLLEDFYFHFSLSPFSSRRFILSCSRCRTRSLSPDRSSLGKTREAHVWRHALEETTKNESDIASPYSCSLFW